MPIIGILPNNITNGQAVDANPVMADFNFIVNQVNANANPTGTLTAPSGTRAVFQQATAPLGWTADASITDHTLQLTAASGSIVTSGNAYSGMFLNAWTSGGHALTVAELAAHNHGITDPGHTHTDTGHNHTGPGGVSFFVNAAGSANYSGGSQQFTPVANTAIGNANLAANVTSISVNNNGSGNAHTHTTTFNVNYAQAVVGVKS